MEGELANLYSRFQFYEEDLTHTMFPLRPNRLLRLKWAIDHLGRTNEVSTLLHQCHRLHSVRSHQKPAAILRKSVLFSRYVQRIQLVIKYGRMYISFIHESRTLYFTEKFKHFNLPRIIATGSEGRRFHRQR